MLTTLKGSTEMQRRLTGSDGVKTRGGAEDIAVSVVFPSVDLSPQCDQKCLE